MIFGSVCSGIEAASSAWHPLGWTSAWFAEIEPFPSAVLAHRHPEVPNHGDFTRLIKDRPASVDVLVGGTPCQSFSVAGLRGGLTDHRGNLALAFMALVDVLRPRWVVWENVPGVLSSNGGRDFGSILGALGKLGYGFAYRVLDAQYFGLAQRRKRVFVVGHLGDWRRAAAVLFEPESVRWDSAPRRETGTGVAGALAARLGGCGADDNAGQAAHLQAVRAYGGGNTTGPINVATACLAHAARMDFDVETFIVHTLRGTGHDASEDGTGRGVPLVPITFEPRCYADRSRMGGAPQDLPSLRADASKRGDSSPVVAYQCHGSNVGEMGTLRKGSGSVTGGVPFVALPLPFDTTQITSSANRSNPQPGDPCHPIAAGAHAPAIAFTMKDYGADAGDISPTLRSGGHNKSHANGGVYPGVTTPTMGVRRLTPREMERLQGFPDDHTAIPWRGQPPSECPDGPRAKALGNSMAVPVMHWIGRRIALVDGER